MSDMKLRLYNTLTRMKEDFVPIDAQNVRMYVCGPTVYDYAHIGNARPVIVFDVLYRLLKHLYPGGGKASDGSRVTYVRNITDVDDKINARALQRFGKDVAVGKLTLNEAIRKVTEETANQFHADVAALGCLAPTHEPRATEHIKGMVEMIQHLVDNGCAYLSAGEEGREVLFDVTSMPDYGALSNRRLEDQQAGARIDVKDHKRNPGDFVLWKESTADQPGWEGEFLISGDRVHIHGRPGWHIECSVMSKAHLGEVFDIHGGGLDLIFPHHENEIAQSRCAHGTDRMANVWMHNGYLQVEGRKMSKSEGNFVTIHELLSGWKGFAWPGQVVRYAMLTTQYRQPLDFSFSLLTQAAKSLADFVQGTNWVDVGKQWSDADVAFTSNEFLDALRDDLNTPRAISELHRLLKVSLQKQQTNGDSTEANQLKAGLMFLGINLSHEKYDPNWMDYQLHPEIAEGEIEKAISGRLAFIREKNWAEADRIRDELLEQGIQLKDSKDPETGERVTTWEVRR